LATQLINVITGAGFFSLHWFFDEWSYRTFGVTTLRWYLYAAGIRVKAIGMDRIRKDRPAVYVSNHLSHMDIGAAMVSFPIRIYFVAKRELIRIPIFGWALPRFKMFMIDRSTREKAYESIRAAGKRIRTQGHNVLVYPEGGISKTGETQPFKKGAFVIAVEAGVPIVPVVVRGSNLLFSVFRWESRPGIVEIEILPEVDTSGYTPDNVQPLIDKVRAMVAEAAKKPMGR